MRAPLRGDRLGFAIRFSTEFRVYTVTLDTPTRDLRYSRGHQPSSPSVPGYFALVPEASLRKSRRRSGKSLFRWH